MFEGASCAGIDGDAFFYGTRDDSDGYVDGSGSNNGPGMLSHYTYLRRICLNCPALAECREWAINNEEYGFWGGMTQTELNYERNMRNIRLVSISDKLDNDVLLLRQVGLLSDSLED